MVQYKVFVGTIAEIEAALNAWAGGLAAGVNINAGPLTLAGQPDHKLAEKLWLKEVMYVLPVRSNVAVPQPALVRPNGRN